MTLFHPKLRRAFLKHPDHQRGDNKLTSERLLEYERMLTNLHYYSSYYPQSQSQRRVEKNDDDKTKVFQQSLIDDIEQFRYKYMPKFDEVQKNWAKKQKSALKKHFFAFNPGKTVLVVVVFLICWLLAAYFSKDYRKLNSDVRSKQKINSIIENEKN